MVPIYHSIYLAGYGGWALPRLVPKLIARTELHRAWLSGKNGCFEQDGVVYELARPYPDLD